MSDAETNPAPSTHWIGKALAVLLTVAIVVVVFWGTHPGGDQPSGGGNSNRFSDPQISTIESIGDGTWRAYAGGASVRVSGNPADTFEYRVRMFPMIDDDGRVLIRAYRMLLQDPNAAKAIDLSPEQMDKLRAADPPGMVISDDDRQHFENAWHEWEKADDAHKPKARDAVLDLLRDMAKKSADPTKQAWSTAANSVKQTLTLEQMAKLTVYEQANGGPRMGGRFGGGFGRGFGGGFGAAPTTSATQPH